MCQAAHPVFMRSLSLFPVPDLPLKKPFAKNLPKIRASRYKRNLGVPPPSLAPPPPRKDLELAERGPCTTTRSSDPNAGCTLLIRTFFSAVRCRFRYAAV